MLRRTLIAVLGDRPVPLATAGTAVAVGFAGFVLREAMQLAAALFAVSPAVGVIAAIGVLALTGWTIGVVVERATVPLHRIRDLDRGTAGEFVRDDDA